MAPKIQDVSVAEYAEWSGVTSQRVYQWIQEGMPHRMRGKTTRLVPKEATKWRLERAAEQAKRVDQEGLPNKFLEEALTARVNRQMKELELKRALRELVPIETFTEFVEGFVGGFAAVATGQLQRFERTIVEAATPGAARRITQGIQAALMTGARQYAEQLSGEADAIEAEAAEPPAEAPAA